MSDQIGFRIAVTPDNRVEIEEFPIPQPGNGQVLIKTISTLISAGTELGTQEQKRDRNIYTGYFTTGHFLLKPVRIERNSH